MKKFFEEFKTFISKGNVLGLAIGIIIGGAFNDIVNSLINDVIMPVIGRLLSGVSFESWYIPLDGKTYASFAEAKAASAPMITIGNFISGQKDMDHLVGLILECTLTFGMDADGNTVVSVDNPKLIPTVTHYDEAFENLRVMLLRDYTPELADRHGVHEYDELEYDDIFTMLEKYVIGDVLDLPEKKQRGR